MNEIEALVILSQIPHLGPVKIRQLIGHFGHATKVLDADKIEIEQLPGFGTKISSHWRTWEKNNVWQENLELVERHCVRIIPFTSSDYPKRLLELHDAPILLYVKGNLLPLDQQSLAVIGTRQATRYGLEMAERITKGLSTKGFTIVSGLARGIDTMAHKTAIQQGRTLAIIGSGLSHIYPRENLKLAEQILEKGALISEFPMKTPPDRQNFPQRNRIVSGITLGAVLIEAPLESGAMLTMQKAFSQGNRKLFAVPGPAHFESFKGNHRLIKTGEALLVEDSEDILNSFQDLLSTFKTVPFFVENKIHLEEEEKKLLAQIPSRDLSFDEVAELTRLSAVKLNVLLMGLVLKKAIKEYPGKIYKKVV